MRDDNIPDRSPVLRLQVGDLRQLFDSLDPAPFRERDLDPKVDEYVYSWAEQLPPGPQLRLDVSLDKPGAAPGELAMLGDAVTEYFQQRAIQTRIELSRLLRTGRISLVIGVAFLSGAVALGEFISTLFGHTAYAQLIRESLIIGGWVALWRPMEIFLYSWWPIRAKARVYERLGDIQVDLHGKPQAPSPTHA